MTPETIFCYNLLNVECKKKVYLMVWKMYIDNMVMMNEYLFNLNILSKYGVDVWSKRNTYMKNKVL